MNAFYQPLGDDRFVSTRHTAGPWSPDSQHLGPPAALLTRELERGGGEGENLARLTVEVLGPVPVAELTVRSWVERPGRSVRLAGAELAANGRAVARAWAWWHAYTDTGAVVEGAPEPLPPVVSGTPKSDREDGWLPGYLDAMEWVSLKGGLGEVGPATLWVRQRVALVDGEQPSGLQRLMAVADSGNGASSLLDVRRWLFINTDLTVHVWRVPVGEWIGMDANTVIGPAGVGTAGTVLYDESGAVARGAQALLVRPRT